MHKISHRHYHMYSPSLDAMMREVLHTLGDVDFAAGIELKNVEVGARDEHIKSKIRAAHWERRQPYVAYWKHFGGNSTARQPASVSTDRLAGLSFAERLHRHWLSAQTSRPGESASADNSYRHPLFGANVVASIIHQSSRKEEQ